MQLHQLTEHIYYTDHDPAVDRPVLGYITGSRFAVMIDAGNSASHVQDYLTLLTAQGLAAPKYCALTHWHWDHTFGLHAFPGETIACRQTNDELRRLAQWSWDEAAMQARLAAGTEIAFADEHIRTEYAHPEDIIVRKAAITFDNTLELDLGGLTCRLLHVPSAHSEDAVVIHIPEEQLLFIGDCDNDDFYHDHYRDLAKTRALHAALDLLDFELALPGHSAPLAKTDLLAFLQRFF